MSPIFEYYCDSCGQTTDELFSTASRPDSITCSKCGTGKAKYSVAPSSFKIKGANFNNGYAGPSNWSFVKNKKLD